MHKYVYDRSAIGTADDEPNRAARAPQPPILLREMIGSVAVLTLNRPEARNSLSEGLIAELDAALPFVLLGDSGQEDARIYREVVRRHPGRIKAIYIRDVQVPERALLVGPISEELGREGVPMVLVPDYATAAAHAAGLGLVV